MQYDSFRRTIMLNLLFHSAAAATGTDAERPATVRNVTVLMNTNNVVSFQKLDPHGVKLLGVVSSLQACEDACYRATAPAACQSFTWHHTDFEKPGYRGHCYAHLDSVWSPVAQGKIDSGCRNDLPADRGPNCSAAVAPSPKPSPTPCTSDFDCSGANGNCTLGSCVCKAGWTGALCNELLFAHGTSRVAYTSPDWTWGGSPILDDTGTYHLFSSRISNNCGILHYCINSEVIHLTAPNATGPFVLQEVALAPRAAAWDNGAIHGISVHRLPNRSYALFYMGTELPGLKAHPNCTPGSGDTAANRTTGSHNGRRIGIATSASLNGPWRRLAAPLFGPDPQAWDNIDVSNPSPIINRNGSVIMLYKGRGKTAQHMGLAFATSVDGPWRRNGTITNLPDLPGEDPFGWIDDATGVYHALFHTGNGANSAGTHCWSADGIVWHGQDSTPAYTGHMEWAPDTDPVYARKTTILARRERPQLLLSGEGAKGGSYGQPRVLFTSAEDCEPKVDGGLGVPCKPATCPAHSPSCVGTDKSYTVLQSIAV